MNKSFEVLHESDFSWIIGVEGDPYEYTKANPGTIVMHENKIVCCFKDNLNIGKLVDNIMKGLRQRNIKDSKIFVYPINYYIQDKVDFRHNSGLITVEL